MTINNDETMSAYVYREIQRPFWWIHFGELGEEFRQYPIGFFVIDVINTLLSSYDSDLWKKYTDKTEEQRVAVYNRLFDDANYLKRMMLNTEWLKGRKNHVLNTYEWCQHLGEQFMSTLVYPDNEEMAIELAEAFVTNKRDPTKENYRYKTLGFDTVIIGNKRIPVEKMYFPSFQMHYLFEQDLCYYLFQPNAGGTIKECKRCHMLFYSPRKGNIKYCHDCKGNPDINKEYFQQRKKDPATQLPRNIRAYIDNVLCDDNEKNAFNESNREYKTLVKNGEKTRDEYICWLESERTRYKDLKRKGEAVL